MKRRLAILERSIELPITAERFKSCVEDHMRLTGVNFSDAVNFVIAGFSVEKLNSLAEKLLDAGFGADTAAKEEWKRNNGIKSGT
jgi:hypothetical protein